MSRPVACADRAARDCISSQVLATGNRDQDTTGVSFQNALEDSEHRLGLFVESVREYAIFQLKPEGRILYEAAVLKRFVSRRDASKLPGACLYTSPPPPHRSEDL